MEGVVRVGLLGFLGRQGVYKWCEWDRHQGMDDNELALEYERKCKEQEKQEKKYRAGYKRAFGIYPEQHYRGR